MDFKQAKRNRKFDSWLLILLLLSLTIGLNFLASRIDGQIDVTPDSKHTLSRETLALLNQMESPVDVIITIQDNNSLPKVVQKLLHDLDLLLESFENSASAKEIRVHRVDVNSATMSSDVINRYNLTEANLIMVASPEGEKKIVFRYEDVDGVSPYDLNEPFRSKDGLARDSLLKSGLYGDEWVESANGIKEPKLFRGEELITRAILEVAGKPQLKRVAYFTRGHGECSPADVNAEKGYSELRRILEDKNLQVATIDLSVSESIPKDAKLLIIAGPKATFQDKEVSLMRNFLNQNDGNLLVALDPTESLSVVDRPAFGLRPLFKEWGLRCHDMLVSDPNTNNFDFTETNYLLRTYYSDEKTPYHPTVKVLAEQGYSIQAHKRCRPVEVDPEHSEGLKPFSLVYSSSTSWAVSGWVNRKTPPVINLLLDKKGPIPIASLSSYDEESKSSSKYFSSGKLVVLGCSKILSNERLKSNTGNQFLAQNLIYWIKNSKEMLEIPPKPLDIYHVSMSSDNFEKLLYSLSIVPGFVALLGIFVGWLRKEL
jgi:hypothetical protein